MMLFANVLCDPPLGNFTVVPFHQKSVGIENYCIKRELMLISH